MPYRLNFAITNLCNSRCTTCQTWQEYRKYPERRKEEFTLEEISKIFKNISPFIRWLSLTGGEPFLREDFIQIVHCAVRNIPELAIISLPTNGLLTERITRFVNSMRDCEGPDISISFSLDGPPEIHDKQRGISGAYDTTWNTYCKTKTLLKGNKRFHLHIETTISSINIHYLKPFFQELIREGHSLIATVAHNAYFYKNEGTESISLNPADAVTKDLFSFLHRHYSSLSPVSLLHKAFIRRLPHYLENAKKQVLPCSALKSSFSIGPYGDVYPCLMWGKRIGNVRNYNFNVVEILKSPDAIEAQHKIRENQCPNCWTPCEAYQSIIYNAPRAFFT